MFRSQTHTGSPSFSWWTIRFYFLIFIGGTGFLGPFLTLFYERQGLSGTRIGFLGSLGAVVGLLAAPLWGRWSDRTAAPQRLLQLSLFASIVLMLVVSQQTVFLYIAVLIGLNHFFTAGMDPLSTVMALKPGGGEGATHFGSIRLWGSLGWAIIVLTSGWLIEQQGIFSAFVGYALAMLASVVLLGFLGNRGASRQAAVGEADRTTRILVRNLVRNPMMLGLGIALLVSWGARLGAAQFEPLFMESLGAGETMIGLASALGALVELPAMLWADQLIRKFGSWALLNLTFGLYALMALLVLAVPAVPMILLTRLLGGVAFSLITVALVIFLDRHAPAGQSTTTLALYTITLRNTVVLLAAPVGGQIYDLYGAYWLYLLAFAGSLASLGVLKVVEIRTQKGAIDV